MEQLDSSTLRWRRGLLTACVVGFAALALNVFEWSMWLGQAGLFTTSTSVPFHDAATAVTPGGPAAKAGIKNGDVVDLRSASARARWRFRTQWVKHETLRYLVLRGATERRLTLRPERRGIDLSGWSWFVGALGALIFATIIAWRRPWLVEARVLCLLLISLVVQICLQTNTFVTPWAPLDFAAVLVGVPVGRFVTCLLVAYTLLFGRPISKTRKAIAAFAFLVIGFDLLYSTASAAGFWSGAFDIWGGPIGMSPFFSVWEPLAYWALPPIAIATAVIATRGRERSLLVWTTAMPFLMYVASVVSAVGQNMPALESSETFSDATRYIANGAQFLTPLAIGYALLHRRLLDIGFVLNQAAIFSGVSLTLVGLFMLGEWLIGSWLGQVSHATNLTISAVLVLALGFSVRVIHNRVERVLDRVFFRKRHDDETAILNFAEQAADATDAVALMRETKETLEQHADAEFVTFAMDDGRGRYGNVSANDPAIVALHDRHNVLDLKTLSTQMRGEFAYPMMAHGRLVGGLVLGPKRSGDNYAPDESHAIMRLAREVGAALHVLSLAQVLREHHIQV